MAREIASSAERRGERGAGNPNRKAGAVKLKEPRDRSNYVLPYYPPQRSMEVSTSMIVGGRVHSFSGTAGSQERERESIRLLLVYLRPFPLPVTVGKQNYFGERTVIIHCYC